MTQEEIERLKQDAQGVNIGTYVASGAINIQKIENVERLYPGSIDKLHDLVKKEANKSRKLTDDELRTLINSMLHLITQHRHWFCIIKPLMLHGQVRYNDFAGAKARIDSLFPAGFPKEINAEDLQTMHTGTLRDNIKDWDMKDSPWKNDTIFKSYVAMATDFEKRLKEMLAD